MKDGFIRVAAATLEVSVADPVKNRERIWEMICEGQKQGAKIMVFPELCLTAYTCGDLFLQDALLASVEQELLTLIQATQGMDMLIFVGLPWMKGGKLYNVAAAIHNGVLLGFIPKRNIPNYSEFYEMRHFTPGEPYVEEVEAYGRRIPFGGSLLFRCKNIPELIVGAEICEDLWVMDPPGVSHAKAGALVIVNCSASDAATGKQAYRKGLVSGQSARLLCAYVYANAGAGESTQDLVFSGHNLIVENGTLLAESKQFESGIIYGDIDLERLRNERRRMTTFQSAVSAAEAAYVYAEFNFKPEELCLRRTVEASPFVPSSDGERAARCEEILMIQALGLRKRLAHTGSRHAVVGISGGLDSTLALLVTARAFDLLGLPRENILSVTMPCFGTTDRTYQNACTLTKRLGAALKEVNIREAVAVHFRDVGQDMECHDVTYENAQARERTQVLMDLANQNGGLVIGTGDMSELALGWATYNGDHMSMYGVNASVPKTLVRHLVRYCADSSEDETLREVLLDILDTPVSPELLPPSEGQISQKTEDLVGPYELHDFFLYYILRYGYRPSKIFRLAKLAFAGEYGEEIIYKWLSIFYRRFFSQQFKRSCLPDGPKVGSVAVSPRGDLRMPSDAVRRVWMEELETVRPEGFHD